jgi:hypothetical protein
MRISDFEFATCLIFQSAIRNPKSAIKNLSKPIMLFDIFAYVPGAGHTLRKGCQIPFADFYRCFALRVAISIRFQGFMIVYT